MMKVLKLSYIYEYQLKNKLKWVVKLRATPYLLNAMPA